MTTARSDDLRRREDGILVLPFLTSLLLIPNPVIAKNFGSSGCTDRDSDGYATRAFSGACNWYAREDSNLWPSAPEADALSGLSYGRTRVVVGEHSKSLAGTNSLFAGRDSELSGVGLGRRALRVSGGTGTALLNPRPC